MKTGYLVTALVTTLMVAAVAGKAQAGDNRPDNADTESAMNGTWMGQGATDTGNLPDASGGASAGSRIVSGNTEVSTVEVGGIRYRLEIDTGP